MRRILPAVGVLLVAAVAAGVIWFYAAGNVGDPTEVTAPLITAATPDVSPATTESPSTTARSAPASSESDDREDSPSTEPEPTAAPSEEPTETTVTTASTETTVPDVTVELELAGGTEARFLIFEELQGEPFTVVGVTTEVVGRVRVDRSDLSNSQMGDILINARTFATDSSNRDRAIRGPILASEQFEFIVFRPGSLIGLSGAAEEGGEWRFAVEGALTVRDVTRPVIFEVVARWGPGDVLEGAASAAVLRSEFDLSVPPVPFVANVADEIILELDFIAQPSGLG